MPSTVLKQNWLLMNLKSMTKLLKWYLITLKLVDFRNRLGRILGSSQKLSFENIMELKPKDRDIIEASRMKGHLRKRIGDRMVDLPRLMYLWCSPQFRIKVEENKPLLIGKKDETTQLKYFIRNHLPDAYYGVRQHYNDWVRDIIKTNQFLPS